MRVWGRRAIRGMGMAALVALALLPASAPGGAARAQGDDEEAALRQVAAAAGRDPAGLALAAQAPLTLPTQGNGRITRVKALDVATGEIVGAAFLDGRLVDEQALRRQAAVTWRVAHGAMTPALVEKLAGLVAQDKLDVAVWLAVEVEALPTSEVRPVAVEGERSTAGPLPAAVGQGVQVGSSKRMAQPVPPEQVPAEVRARLEALPGPPDRLPPEAAKTLEEAAAPARLPSEVTAQQAAAFDTLNMAALQTQIAPVRAAFLDRLGALLGRPADYAGELVPVVYLAGVTRAQVEALARWPEIDAMYPVENVAGPSLAVARLAQNADLVNAAGYSGTGVEVAVVEGERVDGSHPNLNVVGTYNTGQAVAEHPTAVAGILGSTHATYRGLAPGVALYSANGSYTNYGVMSAALDWAATQATVLNNSYFWNDNGTSGSLSELDRRMDYIVRYLGDFATVAAGNFAQTTPYVVTPGKGYNALTVGDYNDYNNVGWTGDAMSPQSSYGDPGHAKPEVAAIGSDIISTRPAGNIGPVGSGTSYASPMVAALAADLIGANASLTSRPAAVRSILMAAALHNIEGDARLSERDGTGGVVATAALAILERGHWAEQPINSATGPLDYTLYANQGERVRFVINWLSNPDAGYTSDPLPADLDLVAFRQNGTRIAYSTDYDNNFEIVDFVAPESETYTMHVTRYGSWSGGETRLGVAWWRGSYHLAPGAGYADAVAPPLGRHLAAHPLDWPPGDAWRAVGIRPSSSDHDLQLFSASWFDDPAARRELARSRYAGGAVDLIAVDGNHRPANQVEYYVLDRFSGSGGYAASWSNGGTALAAAGVYGPYTMGRDEVVKAFDLLLSAGQAQQVSIVPTNGDNDLAAALFRSNMDDPVTWTQGRSLAAATADAYGTGTNVERLTYTYNAGAFDYLGLVVYSKLRAPASFYVSLQTSATLPRSIYLPVLIR